MTSQTSMGNSFPATLSSHLKIPVYNYAFAAQGPSLALRKFLTDDRFKGSPSPHLLIWGLTEHNFSAARMLPELKSFLLPEAKSTKKKSRPSSGLVNWATLSPRRLSSELTGSSVLAQVSRNFNELIRYHILGLYPEDVFISKSETMIFNTWNTLEMKVPWSDRDPKSISYIFSKMKDLLATRHIKLYVVLIPEKEHVYAEEVPTNTMTSDDWEHAKKTWREMQTILRGLQIPYCDALQVLTAARKEGKEVYWRDDTHWNPGGAQLVAKQIAVTLMDQNLARKPHPE